ncbi:MAG: twin-arginine translocation signal domain-containing protein [Kiritimatiellae bacterium]|nr:twin-arginine translocation signal domain-containing protein [Kiritimatiellia bacterium]
MAGVLDRREFIANAALAGGALALGDCACLPRGRCERLPYGDTIGDRLWMWGHHADSFASMKGAKEQYNLPFDRRIDMADACKAMNIPGCFVVRWRNLPTKANLPEYMEQFRNTKRIGFSITDSAVESFDETVRLGFEYADKMPNLTTLIMDDFWSGAGKGSSMEQLARVREGTESRGMKLGVVLYSDANGVKSEFKEVLDLCDEVTFWFWNGKNVGTIEEQVGKLRDLIGAEKPVLLGQYMWDFGGKKPMPGAYMERQLGATSRLLSQKAIHGVIFHCTPLVDMNLDAVNVSRAWIKENGPKKWGA